MALNVQCKKCVNLRNDWCKLVVDSPDPDMVRDCQYYRGKTNADRIRAMTNEELAEAFERSCPNDSENRCCTYFAKGSNGCFNCWIDWLKQEVFE